MTQKIEDRFVEQKNTYWTDHPIRHVRPPNPACSPSWTRHLYVETCRTTKGVATRAATLAAEVASRATTETPTAVGPTAVGPSTASPTTARASPASTVTGTGDGASAFRIVLHFHGHGKAFGDVVIVLYNYICFNYDNYVGLASPPKIGNGPGEMMCVNGMCHNVSSFVFMRCTHGIAVAVPAATSIENAGNDGIEVLLSCSRGWS